MSAVIDYKRKIYAARDLPTLPIIAQKIGKRPHAQKDGVGGFVQKPFELQKLAALIRDVLDGVAV